MLIAALLLTLTSISCTRAPSSVRVLARDLPPKPAWAQPVGVSRPPAGTDLVEVAKREQLARQKANAIIVRFGDWYDERRADLATK